MYNFRSLFNKIATTLLDGDFIYFFDPVLFFHSQRAIKMSSSRGTILLWSASPFLGLEETEYIHLAPRVFAKRWREG